MKVLVVDDEDVVRDLRTRDEVWRRETVRDRAYQTFYMRVDEGYQDPSNFGRAFRGWFGMSPGNYRKKARWPAG